MIAPARRSPPIPFGVAEVAEAAALVGRYAELRIGLGDAFTLLPADQG